MRVLIVDDERVCLEDLRQALVPAGFEIDTATGVSEALSMYEQHRHDCVITDFRMPDGNGADLARRLPEDATIVIMSGYSPDEVRAEPGADRALAFLPKPVDFRLLMTILDSIRDGR